MASALRETLARRAILRAGKNLKRRRKVPKQVFPSGAATLYRKVLLDLVAEMREAIRTTVVEKLPNLVRESDMAAGRRTDAPEDEIDTLTENLRARFGAIVDKKRVRELVLANARQVSTFNRGQVSKQTQALVGVDLPDTERFLYSHLELYARDNVNLVTKMAAETLTKIENTVTAGARAGLRHEDIAAEVMRVADVSESRAALIARDQVAKLNGELTRARQTSVGIEEYRWETSGDERVRESHKANDGKVFRWDDPPAETGHPGEDYQCFTGSTKVYGFPPIERIFRGSFRGELTQVVTSAGESFEATANHPVLTRRGWVRASQLQLGDELLDGRTHEPGTLHVDENHGISFADLFGALSRAGAKVTVNASGSEFYGDAAVNEKIDVISVDWELLLHNVPTLSESAGQEFFSGPHAALAGLPSEGTEGQLFATHLSSAARFVRSFGQAFALLRGGAPHAEEHSVSPGAGPHSVLFENSNHRDTGDAQTFGDCLHTPSGPKPLQDGFVQVVNLVRRESSCHVYTLQTVAGWYHVGAVVANCRCVAIPILPEFATEAPAPANTPEEIAAQARSLLG